MKWLFRRLAEPSSSAGIAASITAVAAGASGSLPWGAAIAAGLAGVLAVLFPEGGKP